MNIVRMSIIAVLVVFAGSAAYADGNVNPANMANQVGFFGCNSLISRTFRLALNSPTDKKFTIDYFDETAKSSVGIYTTWGSTGDTIWQSAHFEKHGGYCYSQERSMISTVANCAGLLSGDSAFKYTTESAGALWSKNKGGVNKIFIQSGNACVQIFINSRKQKVVR